MTYLKSPGLNLLYGYDLGIYSMVRGRVSESKYNEYRDMLRRFARKHVPIEEVVAELEHQRSHERIAQRLRDNGIEALQQREPVHATLVTPGKIAYRVTLYPGTLVLALGMTEVRGWRGVPAGQAYFALKGRVNIFLEDGR